MSKPQTQAEKAKAALDANNAAKAAEAAAAKQPTAPKEAAPAEAAPADKPEEKKPELKKGEFLNPLADGVTYEDFLASIPKGKTLDAHCKGKLSKADLIWLKKELEHYEKNKK